ncbi:MAG: restriction endonuclease subunit S [Desulfamplus sp.]|nr:restriction endonuclease subunit S [Desulfamplus sp.]
MMKPYPRYKDSGIEWLGEIPEHWDLLRLKHFTSIISKGTTPSTIDKAIMDEGEIKFIKAENIKDNALSDFPRNFIDSETDQLLQRSRLFENDILFVIAGATIGKVAVLTNEFVPANTNQAVCFIRLEDKEESIFTWFWLQSPKVQELIWIDAVQAAQPNLSMEDLGNIYCPSPLSNEKNEIANFLDHKTHLIDTLIQKKKRLIDLLKEERTAVINEAVIKGLDPDVPMKDSGIEWLGEIPEHWEICAFKYILVVKDGTHDTPKPVPFSDNVYPLITSKNLKNGFIDFKETTFISEEEHKKIILRSNVSYGDIIMPMIGTIGNPVIVNTKREFSIKNVALFKSNPNVSMNYITYLFNSIIISTQFDLNQSGGVQNFVSLTILNNLIVPKIKLHEQQEIADYLDRETNRIDTLLTKTTKEIELLQEYRTALISEVVTGKIDVRDWKKPEIAC